MHNHTNWTAELVNAVSDMWSTIRLHHERGLVRLTFVQIDSEQVIFALSGHTSGPRFYEFTAQERIPTHQRFVLSREDPADNFPDEFDLEVVSALACAVPHLVDQPVNESIEDFTVPDPSRLH